MESASIFPHPNKTLIRIYASDLPETILSNMTCNVDILIGERENALLIPISSLANGYVWVKRGKSIPPYESNIFDQCTISCNSYHNLMLGGEDQRSVSVRVHGQKGDRGTHIIKYDVLFKKIF